MADTDAAAVEYFIVKWRDVTASELSTAQSFALDPCALLGVDTPHPTAHFFQSLHPRISWSSTRSATRELVSNLRSALKKRRTDKVILTEEISTFHHSGVPS